MKIYKYLYYRLYCIWLKKKDEPENAQINAIITITFLVYVNIMSIPLTLIAILKRDIINLPEISVSVKAIIIGFLLVTGFINYLILARKKQHELIINLFKNESNEEKSTGVLYTWLYIIISIGIPLCIGFFTNPFRTI